MDLYNNVNFEEKELKNLTTKAKDWAIAHGTNSINNLLM